ncbi:hypothetical protein, partial [Yersinia rohdei]|uniref:hypothetical protein n=1 Tax=Yersinia rohdei TaxID=29485 RepID=UPI0025AA9C14
TARHQIKPRPHAKSVGFLLCAQDRKGCEKVFGAIVLLYMKDRRVINGPQLFNWSYLWLIGAGFVCDCIRISESGEGKTMIEKLYYAKVSASLLPDRRYNR